MFLKSNVFANGTGALIKTLEKLNIKKGDLIALPDYYCEELFSILGKIYSITLYPIKNDYSPDLSDISKKQIKAIILVQYFNLNLNLNNAISECRNKDITTILDCVHIFPKHYLDIYSEVNGIIFSFKKPLYLNEGAICYVDKKIIKTDINISCFDLIRNFRSLAKFLRFLLGIFKLNINNYIFMTNNKKIIKVSNKFKLNYSADLVTNLIYILLKKTILIEKINNNILQKINNSIHTKNVRNILFFAYEKKDFTASRIKFKWPLKIGKTRTKYWTKNSEYIYKSRIFTNPYF